MVAYVCTVCTYICDMSSMYNVLYVHRLTEEKKEVESEIQRQPKVEVRTYVCMCVCVRSPKTLLAAVTLSSVMLYCTAPALGPLVVIGCRAEAEGADQ